MIAALARSAPCGCAAREDAATLAQDSLGLRVTSPAVNHEPGLPAFPNTGSSFVDLLRTVAPDALPPSVMGPSNHPFEITHGTTVVAIRCEGGVVMAGDRRATSGFTIANRRIEKVFAADELSGVAIAGAAGPAVEMVRLFQVQLQHYEKVEGEQLSLEGKANQLAQMVRSNLPAAMQGFVVVPLFAGYDIRRRLVGCSASTPQAASTKKPTTRRTARVGSTPGTGSRPAGAKD